MSAISIPCPACGQALKLRDRSLLGRKAKCPKCGHAFLLEEPEEVELRLVTEPPPAAVSFTPEAPAVSVAPAMGAPLIDPQTSFTPAVVSPAAELATAVPASPIRRRRNKKSRNLAGPIIAVVALVAAGAGGIYVSMQPAPPTATAQKTSRPTGSTAAKSSVSEEADETSTAMTDTPTRGKPISLEMVPAGAQTILHLRPAQLWAAGSKGEEFRFCLGPLGEFANQQIQALCHCPPADIEELLLAWIPTTRGMPPDLSVVVRLKKELKKSEMLDRLGGTLNESYGHPVYIEGDRAHLIANLTTYAIAPASMAQDLVHSMNSANPMPLGIESIIKETDRDRHMTLIFSPSAALLDAEFMATPATLSLFKACLDWFGDDAEAVVAALHLEDDRFYTNLMVRNTTSVGPAQLEQRMRKRVDELPENLLATVRMMRPSQQGRRELIGRLPAMFKVFAMATLIERQSRLVKLTVPLPDRAAPNLALASLLAWDESSRTDFSRQPEQMPRETEGANLPTTIAERLNKKIDVDFRRTPLQEAFAYIADETKVTIEIDGDALKLAGYTQNMPQTFLLEQAPATKAIGQILKNYDKMCLVVDEKTKVATVMTFQVATQKQLTPFPIQP